jgi:hypothetical protein
LVLSSVAVLLNLVVDVSHRAALYSRDTVVEAPTIFKNIKVCVSKRYREIRCFVQLRCIQ